MRAFIAIDIIPQPALIQFLQLLQNNLSVSAINWVDLQKLHLTLAFLGEIDNFQKDSVAEMLRQVACRQSPMELSVEGFGFFGSVKQPRVLWVGIAPNNALSGLHSEITKQLKLLDFQLEDRVFHPHVTLGRVKSDLNHQTFHSLVKTYSDHCFQKSLIGSIVFYQSRLRPQGPVYTPIETFLLGS